MAWFEWLLLVVTVLALAFMVWMFVCFSVNGGVYTIPENSSWYGMENMTEVWLL